MESMRRTLRGQHSGRRELRIFEILEALLAREIIERPSMRRRSIHVSIRGHYYHVKIRVLILR